jgi:L,D-peptidoglycan transpeptidase YkuD (ErfK/YbiS/YcfS/YnhG family)
VTVVAAVVFGITGCAAAGGGHPPPAQAQPAFVPGATPVASTARAASTAPSASAAPTASTASAASAAPATAAPQAASAAQGTVRQLVTVVAASYRATQAELTAYQRVSGQWRRVFGPWAAWIGRNGMAPPGAKREGDGSTPSGTFGFGFFFGAEPDPGVRFPYRMAHAFDFWDDDPSSPLYNEWVDDRYASPGADPEPMDVSAYDYGAVIGYNTARRPGLGSAIFLHINIGMPTAGCVALPAGELLEILRWLNPAASPRIAMGVGALGMGVGALGMGAGTLQLSTFTHLASAP